MNMLQNIERLGIAIGHGNHICDVRELIDQHHKTNDEMRCQFASGMIKSITGIEVQFIDDNIALATTQALVDQIVRNKSFVDVQLLIDQCTERATALVTDPKNKWMYKKPDHNEGSTGMKTEVEGVNIQVEVKADGKIKKGGKAVLAVGLMNRYLDSCVAESKPYIPKEMKAILVKDCQMSDLGAGTYEYGLRVTQKLIELYQTEKGVTIATQMKGKK